MLDHRSASHERRKPTPLPLLAQYTIDPPPPLKWGKERKAPEILRARAFDRYENVNETG